jgi:hypothetical protein
LLCLVLAGCSDDKVVAPNPSDSPNPSAITVDPQAIAAELVSRAGWEVDASAEVPDGLQATEGAGCVLTSERQVIVDDIVHYSFLVSVGPGPYDVIGLHRVVREKKPGTPIKTKENIFLQHGDGVGFVKFIIGAAAPSMPDDFGAAIFLAENDVDVWGIDQSWVFVPTGITDFSFMADWGFQHDINNLSAGLGIARVARAMTGSGYGKMNLLGYSSGSILGYAYLSFETQLPPGLRHVGGFMPADCPVKFDLESSRQASCEMAALYVDMLESGIYEEDDAYIIFIMMGDLAKTDPDGDSPILPGLTNLQATLFVGTTTYALFPFTPWWHYVAGVYDESGMPVGLQYTDVDGYLDFITSASPYQPSLFYYDYLTLLCDEEDSPFDDHLGEITVPVLCIAPAGGLGEADIYSTTLLGSTDVTILLIRLLSAEEVTLDFGHIDLWTAENAPSLVWQPMYNWIKAHTEHGQGKGDITMK